MVEQQEQQKIAEQTVFVGSKPFMNYVTSTVMLFTTQNAKSLVIKARGKFIARAVDIIEVVRNRFLEDQLTIKDIKIGSEQFENREGKQVRVSTIEIYVEKK
ncbi:MAG: DNA-binding protein Alba [Nanoarchaeota archaeon]